MLKNIIKEKVYCGLDMGSQEIKAALIKAVDPSVSNLVGVYEAKTSGFQKSSVSDLGELTDCIHKAVSGLAKKTGIKVKDLNVGVGGDLVRSRSNSAVIPLVDHGSKVIGNHDVRKINNQARLLGVKVEEEILHYFSQNYKVDEVNTALNPIGLYGRKLEVNSSLIVADVTRLRNITKAVNRAGYEISNLFFSGFSSSAVSLTDTDKTEGVVLIDVGAMGTDILIFKNGVMEFLDRISMGGRHVTHCIAKELNLPFNLSEDIKKSYAIAVLGESRNEEEILVRRDSAYIPIKRQDIYNSVKDEIDKFVGAIKHSLNKSKIIEDINNGIVMVGGGSLLSGLLERIEAETNLPVKLGKIKVGKRSLTNAAKFSSAMGLAQLGLMQATRRKFPFRADSSWTKYMTNRIKEFYQEYF